VIARALAIVALVLVAGCAALPDGFGRAPPEGETAAAPADVAEPATDAAEAASGEPADPSDPADPAATDPAADADAPAAVAPAAPEPRDPNLAARMACTGKGGAFSRTKGGAFVCVTRTRDFNKSCSASSQCDGMCLARSGTCAPLTPLIGCHDVLTDSGGKATVCID
jgi:hypothetical protein